MQDTGKSTRKNHNQQTPQAEMHLRCPQCYKLYVVEARTVCTEKPEFQCTQCEQRFWVNFPEALEFSEVVAFPTEWNEGFIEDESLDADEIARQSFREDLDAQLLSQMNYEKMWQMSQDQMDFSNHPGPTNDENESHQHPNHNDLMNNSANHPDFTPETSQNKVSIGQNFSQEADEIGSKPWILKRAWEKVLNNYECADTHEGFICETLKLNELDFAYQKYKDIKEANPFDTIAKEQFKKVEGLVQSDGSSGTRTHSVPSASPETPTEGLSSENPKAASQARPQGKAKLKVNVKPSQGLKRYYTYLPWFSLSVAIVLIAIGLMSEPLNHFAGFGFALIFLTGALSLLKESEL